MPPKSDYSLQDILGLQAKVQRAIYEDSKAYGTIGRQNSAGVWQIPTEEKGKRLITVILENGVEVKADSSKVSPVAGAQVWLFKEANQWVIEGDDPRKLTASDVNTGTTVTKHNHNIGNPLYYPVDLASIADGLVLPTGNGLAVTIGRVTYPKPDGTVGIYESEDVLDVSSAVTGLVANQSRWVVFYILRSDGTAHFFAVSAVTGTLNYTTHIEDAVAECLADEPDAFPYHVAKIRAGMSTFGTYKAMQGRSPVGKDFVRLAVSGAMGNTRDIQADTLILNDGSELTIVSDTITVTKARHTVDTEANAASDDLDTVNGLAANEVCVITASDTTRTVVIKHGVDNIVSVTGADISLDDNIKAVLLLGSIDGTEVWAYPLGGSGVSDAADVTYTPADNTDWTGSADPGDVDDALDQLAARVTDAPSATATFTNKTISANANTLLIGAGVSKTLSGDVLSAGTDRHIVVSAESGTTDVLREITGLAVGESIYLRAAAGHGILVDHDFISATVKIHLYYDDIAPLHLDENNWLKLTLVATNILSEGVQNGVDRALSNLVSTSIGTNLIPDPDDTVDVGSSATKWRATYTNLIVLEERTAPSTPASGDYALYSKVTGGAQLFALNDSGIEKQVTTSYAILRDEKTSGTASGGSTASTWNNRNLNTETYDPDGIVSISSNQFTPIAGTYILHAVASAGSGAASMLHRLRLFNVTGAASVEEGTGVQASTASRSLAHLECSFTANGTDAYRIDHYTSVTQATGGLGAAVSDGSPEVFLAIRLEKVA